MRFCRAAFGALVRAFIGAHSLPMESSHLKRKAVLRRRMKRWSAEIVIACLLTLAALAYLGVKLANTSEMTSTNAIGGQESLTTKQ